jgi:acyl dehydratase
VAQTFFEDLEVGDRFGGTTYAVPAGEMLEFSRKWDPRPVHLDAAAARAAGFDDVIASGAYTTAVFTLLVMQARERSGNHAVIAVLGVKNQMPNPVFGGDHLDFDAEIVAKRASRSRPGTGVVTTRGRLTNQRGEVVFDSETVTLVHRRPGGPG